MDLTKRHKLFLAKIDKTVLAGCWLWTACRNRQGYGYFSDGSRLRQAHRWSYEHFIGPIPDGLQIDHTCHSKDLTCVGGPACLHRRCVNPDHLETVTGKVNTNRRSPAAALRVAAHHRNQTHCLRGHEFTLQNTYVYTRTDGGKGRRCRECKRIESRAKYASRPKTEKPDLRFGHIAPGRKAWPEDVARGRALMATGMSLRKAAQEIGLSHTQLRRRLLGIN